MGRERERGEKGKGRVGEKKGGEGWPPTGESGSASAHFEILRTLQSRTKAIYVYNIT